MLTEANSKRWVPSLDYESISNVYSYEHFLNKWCMPLNDFEFNIDEIATIEVTLWKIDAFNPAQSDTIEKP